VNTERPQIGPSALRTFARMFHSREANERLRALIKKTRPDLAHVHNIYTQISPSILDVLRAERVPVVQTIHDYHIIEPHYLRWFHGRAQGLADRSLLELSRSKFHKNSRLASFAQALAFKFHRARRSYELGVDRFLAPSECVRVLHERAGIPRDRLTVLPHFTPLVDRQPEFTDRGYILYFGRLVEEKGVEVLLRAMLRLPRVPCKIVGTGPEEVDLHLFGDRLLNVRFEGYQSGEALWNFVRGARAVVIPSLWEEVFCLVAIEAMALGKPVIASAIGALPEIVRDRETGLLVKPGAVHELTEAIQRLAEDSMLAFRFGRAGRRRAEQTYSPQRHYERLLGFYHDLSSSVESHGRSTPPKSLC
jgi:glycosyltransferase involved in cell wall biosynthesis